MRKTRIRVPKEIKIGAHSYEVLLDESQPDNGYNGTCVHEREEIWINPLSHKNSRRISLLHEVIHLVGRVFDLEPTESSVSRLAEGLGEFLYENLGIELDWSDIPSIKRIREVKKESKKEIVGDSNA